MQIASLTQTLRLQTNINNLQTGLTRTQQQISSGKVADIYSGLRGEDSRISIQLRETISTKESFIDSTETTRVRMKIMETTLVGIQELAQDLRTRLIEQVDGLLPNSAPALKVFADTAIDQLANLLNTQADGRFLFSGTAVTTQPIVNTATLKTNAFAAITPLAVGNAATLQNDSQTFFGTDANWYQGGGNPTGQNRPFRFNADEGVVLEYGELGSDSTTFEELFEVLAVFADVDFAAGLETDYKALVTWGLGKVEAAEDAIGQQIARIGVTHERMIATEASHKDDLVILADQLDDLENIDTAAVIQEFQTLSTQLEASFQIAASLRNLTLSRFI